jgi:hypothetical protein
MRLMTVLYHSEPEAVGVGIIRRMIFKIMNYTDQKTGEAMEEIIHNIMSSL